MSRFQLPFPPPSQPQHAPSALRQHPRYSSTGSSSGSPQYAPPPPAHGRPHNNNMSPQPQHPHHTNQQYLQQPRRGDNTMLVMPQQPPSDWDYNHTTIVPQMYPATHPQWRQQQQQQPLLQPHAHRSVDRGMMSHPVVDEPIIELSERQRQLLQQRRVPPERTNPAPNMVPPPNHYYTDPPPVTSAVPYHPYEPRDLPFTSQPPKPTIVAPPLPLLQRISNSD